MSDEAPHPAVTILRTDPGIALAALSTDDDGPLLVVVPVGFLNGPEVRALLRTSLPADVVPARIAVVEDAARIDPWAVYAYEPPAGELEERIAALWRELLGRDEIGALDDFIDVGGDSMSGVELVNRLDADFGVAVELDEVFQNTTVRGLAGAVRARTAVAG